MGTGPRSGIILNLRETLATMAGRWLVGSVALCLVVVAAGVGGGKKTQLSKLEQAANLIDKWATKVAEGVDKHVLRQHFCDSMSDDEYFESLALATVVRHTSAIPPFRGWARLGRLIHSAVRLLLAINYVIEEVLQTPTREDKAEFEANFYQSVWGVFSRVTTEIIIPASDSSETAGITAELTLSRAGTLRTISLVYRSLLESLQTQLATNGNSLSMLSSLYREAGNKKLAVQWSGDSPLPFHEPQTNADGVVTLKTLFRWETVIPGLISVMEKVRRVLSEASKEADRAEKLATPEPIWPDVDAVVKELDAVGERSSSRSKRTKTRRKKKRGAPSTSSDHDSGPASSDRPSLGHPAVCDGPSLSPASLCQLDHVDYRQPIGDRNFATEMDMFVQRIDDELATMSPVFDTCVALLTEKIQEIDPSATLAVVGSVGKRMNLPPPNSDLDILTTLRSDQMEQLLHKLIQDEATFRTKTDVPRTNARGMTLFRVEFLSNISAPAMPIDIVSSSGKSRGSWLDLCHVLSRPDYYRIRAMVLYLKAYLRAVSSAMDPLLMVNGVGGMSSYLLQVLVIAHVDNAPESCADGDLRECIVTFFKFYGEFDFNDDCIDVTNSDNRFPKKWSFSELKFYYSSVCAIDPHDSTNNIGEMTYRISKVRAVFAKAHAALTDQHGAPLMSLFPAGHAYALF